jgi:hypothetical protein
MNRLVTDPNLAKTCAGVYGATYAACNLEYSLIDSPISGSLDIGVYSGLCVLGATFVVNFTPKFVTPIVSVTCYLATVGLIFNEMNKHVQ